MNTTKAIAYESEIESIKLHLRKTWMAGDYDRFSRYVESEAEAFYERLGVWSAHNHASSDFTVVEAEYLEVIATRA
jgi:hypothetical protein